MIQLVKKENCTGCLACAEACPKGAISLGYDALGHGYPVIGQAECVHCGKCTKVCPEITELSKQSPGDCYALWSLDPQTRKTSASGGAAAEFYAYALEQGYMICGAEYTRNGTVIHTLSRESESIKKYQQSKYVYSDIFPVYRPIKQALDQGEKVLCISLPCKIAGLLGYLGKPYENLITVDIVCHGTPSEQCLRAHLEAVTGEKGELSFHFREDNQFLLNVKKGEKRLYRKVGRQDMYLAAFLEGLNYRKSCYHCRYAEQKRIGDITICDFWGLGQEIPFDHPYTGAISAALLNTEKGKHFFSECRHRFFAEQRPVAEAIKGNAQLNTPTPIHPQKEEFEKLQQIFGFEKAVRICLKPQIKADARKQFKTNVRKSLRKLAGVVIPRYRR